MLDLDGSAGGGQLVRSALALSMLTDTAFRMTGVRESRPNPGLRHQHLAGTELAAELCDAEVEGAAVGADEFAFEPGTLRGGRYGADVGTAGSVTLLLDVVLPLAARIDEPLVASVSGGTDVKWSPTAAYYRDVKLPLLRRFGLQAALDVERTGFYPVGGGEVRLSVAPSPLERFDLTDRGALRGVRAYSKASAGLADAEVAERQASAAVEEIDEALSAEDAEATGGAVDAEEADGADATSTPVVERSVRYVAADSPGSALALRLDYENSIAGFDALGERGKPSEDVAGEAVGEAVAFDAGSAAVDEHAADQLAIFLALSGGRVRIPRVTDHVATSLDLLDAFGFEVRVEDAESGPTLVAD